MEQGDTRERRYRLLHQLDLFGDQLLILGGQSSEMPRRTAETRHIPRGYRVGESHENNRNRVRCFLCSVDGRWTGHQDDIDLELHQLRSEGVEPVGIAFRIAI